jgi:FkbM family methyltransferase
VKAATQPSTVFDHEHYLRLIEARGRTIRRSIADLKNVLGLATSLDAGCGLGFFAQILHESGLVVHAFDGREENVLEGRRRFPDVSFECGDIQNADIRRLGDFDFVLCFGLLYHLENPMAAIRNLRALTRKALLLESMCLPEDTPWMLLREEPRLQDQSLTDVAFYSSEGCLAKMLYRAGFPFVYRVDALPDHDDFKDTSEHLRRRTVLLATTAELAAPGFTPFPEPKELIDPWQREAGRVSALRRRVESFSKKSGQQKYLALAQRARRFIPALPIPMRLSFGAWWLVEHGAVDYHVMTNTFEIAEMEFVKRFLRPGMTVLDIGAHHGLYTLLASKSVGAQGKVISFEPSPRERHRLKKNLRINCVRNVELHPFALGSQKGEADLYLADGTNNGCNSFRQPAESAGETVRVPVNRLDDVLSQLARVDFVKIDVEGAELDTFKGATELLSRAPRPVILAEVYDIRTRPWGYDAREIVRFLADLNYQWFALNDDGTLAAISSDLQTYDANLVALPAERVAETQRMLSKE